MPAIPDCFSLKAKNALVTGSRAGLGAAMAVGLAQAGANVVVNGSTDAGIDDVCRAVANCGVKAVRAVADVSDAAACAALIELTVSELGAIDILINNAGIIRRSQAAEYSAEDWAEVLEINLNAVFRLS
jgi:2-dehydro-3-deoxy-D-gluconate 5-dehydrogenase